MTLDVTRTRSALHAFDFSTLFVEELGWDHQRELLTVFENQRTIILEAIAHKRGMVAYCCPTPMGEHLPDYATRRRIEQQVAKVAHEHFLIFTDAGQTTQIWQWVKREPGKPTACREHRFTREQSGDALIQKLAAIAFTLEEEERLTLVDVTGRARKGFDAERVTKRFFEQFQKQHVAFLKLIDGIAENADQEWYASLMLNRLMFVYFMQRKGFLDGDRDYLQNRLAQCQREQGQDQFDCFYRYFLLRLFHEGLGGKARSPELERLLGRIPYLNGGIFDQHDIESRYPKIKIPDQAFVNLFTYFDQYQWHLDERPLRKDNEINPDVLGYIFEKYINQKQMGAYYTKEDITEYISKSTLIPFLLDAAKVHCAIAFENPNGPVVWDVLKADPDRYLYPAVRHGVDLPLPPEIAIGVDTALPNLLERRKEWNKPAPEDYALPTEIWREVVARRTRCLELRAKLAAGEVRDSNDLITLNLDCRQFAQDVIEQCEGPELLRAFWQALEKVTVLDPTCGSGAFLFAALNILQPLYEACLERMEAFIADADRNSKKSPQPFTDFRQILQQVATHPNSRYFILKRIILNNLFGVDIMDEATEICKLRLFLKLAAQVEPDSEQPNFGIEPLPDIDFNIRAGNTLIGFATEQEVVRIGNLASDQKLQTQIKTQIADLSQNFVQFRIRQITVGSSVTAQEKQDLQNQRKALNHQLNNYLAMEYGKNPENETEYRQWVQSHQPFHWFVEFYAIMKSGGFDVIIGNPPYVEYKEIKKNYQIKGYFTEKSGNIYAFVMDRSLNIISPNGYCGLIVPLSLVATERMSALQKLLIKKSTNTWLSLFDVYPSKLFDGAKQRLSITISTNKSQKNTLTAKCSYCTKYNRWYQNERDSLFQNLAYSDAEYQFELSAFPKFGQQVAKSIFEKISIKKPMQFIEKTNQVSFYVHRIPYNFVKAVNFVPYFWNEVDGQKKSEDYKPYCLTNNNYNLSALASLNSNLFFWWWYLLFEGYHCGKHEIFAFPIGIDKMKKMINFELELLSKRLMIDLEKNKNRKECCYAKTGKVHYDEFFPRLSKPIIDEIDCILAKHYGFTDEELDFIINYDIKYRMGRDAGGEEE